MVGCGGGFDVVVAGRWEKNWEKKEAGTDYYPGRPGNPGPAVDYPGQAGNHYPAAAACGNKTSWTNVGHQQQLSIWKDIIDFTSPDIAHGVPCQPEE